MGQYHLILSRYTVTVSAPMTVEVTADIDKNIWEIYGPHYNAFDYHITGDTVFCLADVQNGKDKSP